jgi:hypothetical protein
MPPGFHCPNPWTCWPRVLAVISKNGRAGWVLRVIRADVKKVFGKGRRTSPRSARPLRARRGLHGEGRFQAMGGEPLPRSARPSSHCGEGLYGEECWEAMGRRSLPTAACLPNTPRLLLVAARFFSLAAAGLPGCKRGFPGDPAQVWSESLCQVRDQDGAPGALRRG